MIRLQRWFSGALSLSHPRPNSSMQKDDMAENAAAVHDGSTLRHQDGQWTICEQLKGPPMMGCFLLFLVMTSLLGESSERLQSSKPNERSVTVLRLDAEAFAKKMRDTESFDQLTPIVLDLCWLHQEIVRHSQFEQSPQLQNVRSQIANQLKKFLKDFQLATTRRARLAKLGKDGADRGNAAKSEPKPSSSPLAGSGDSSSFDEYDLEQWSARHAYQLGLPFGGGVSYLGHMQGNFAPPWDHGEELVRLIETTIDRNFWQRNGGEGRIHYYQPSRVLVVGATLDIHDSISDLLRQLRNSGR